MRQAAGPGRWQAGRQGAERRQQRQAGMDRPGENEPDHAGRRREQAGAAEAAWVTRQRQAAGPGRNALQAGRCRNGRGAGSEKEPESSRGRQVESQVASIGKRRMCIPEAGSRETICYSTQVETQIMQEADICSGRQVAAGAGRQE